jgi:4-hydroxybenzoate polyprenyltransferase
VTLRSVPLHDGDNTRPAGRPVSRKVRDVAAVVMIVIGFVVAMMSLFFINPLAGTATLGLGCVAVGYFLGLE